VQRSTSALSGDRFDRAQAAALTVHVWFLYSMDPGTAGTAMVRVMLKTSRGNSANDVVSSPAVAPVLKGCLPKRAGVRNAGVSSSSEVLGGIVGGGEEEPPHPSAGWLEPDDMEMAAGAWVCPLLG